ncbi:hypothetical protein J7E93_29190 [Streptomyces sp. ISL-36]|uniref:hypothetical protein n=1 Tax=Streptomyces sp. ISL-36 TaxID=2819182 RepID=UPI001BE98A7D|nr:hypothetical protein [Streptomyces sp. ISL-36]MBT2444094.1 hypothetical protein [Streptomyces sp. ISL-36]
MMLPARAQPDSGRDVGSIAILKLVVAEASFIAALMFYVGLIYTSRYYRNFNLSPSSLGFGFSEYVVESLQLLSRPVLVAVVALLLLTSAPHFIRRLPLTSRLRQSASAVWGAVALQYWLVVAAGLVLFLLWPQIEPDWAAPATVAAGLLMGQSRAALRGRGQGLLERAVPLFAALAFLLLAVTLLAAELGDREAKQAARHVVRWPGVVLFSTERLSLTGPSGLKAEDLGPGTHLRYRYTGLRLLIARSGHYYVVPVGWNATTDSVYIFRENDTTRIELTPGVRWS